MIRRNDLKSQIKEFGAKDTAKKLALAMREGHLSPSDMPSVRTLYEEFVTEKNNDKEACGAHILREEILSEEGANLTALDAFNIVTSQIYFNALTTRYSAADYSVSPLFRVIPSNLPSGEKFGGISNLATALAPVPFNRELVSLEPTQDFTQSPPMRQHGAIVDIGLPMMRADATGEIMDMFSRLGEALGTTRELEAVSTLIDVGESSPRCRLNWKGTNYATYQTATPWVNVVSSNALLTPASINAAYQVLQNILDPYTGLPVVTPSSKMKLIVCPELVFQASRIKNAVLLRTGGASNADYNPAMYSQADVPGVDFDIVESKYLKYVLDQNSSATTSWYLGWPDVSFSWQQMYPITVGEAMPNAGDMFRRNIAASYKAFKVETSFAFNPRYMVKNTVA